MGKINKKRTVGITFFSALVILASSFSGVAFSNPTGSTANSEDASVALNGRDLFEQKLAAKRSSSGTSALGGAAKSREVNVDAIMQSLPENLRFSPKSRQQVVEAFQAIGLKSEMPSEFRELRDKKRLGSPEARKSRIIGGQPVTVSAVPWQVALVFSWSQKNVYEGQYCGGSIIGASWILTAAHCVDEFTVKDLVVLSGIDNLPDGPAPRGSTSTVKSIIIHPNWGVEGLLNDVALLELSRPLRFGTNVQPISLAQDTPLAPSEGQVSGWGETGFGYPQQLQSGIVPIVNCPEGYFDYYSGELSEAQRKLVCAGDGVVDACFGDSGGPLVVRGALVGVVSFGPDCPPAGTGAYANVDYYSSWIMCHAQVTNPFGGPHFCGGESGYITVADTLKVSQSAWMTPGRMTVQWYADGFPIRGATRTSLPLRGLFGKYISVQVKVGTSTYPTTSPFTFEDASGDLMFVEEALEVKFYASGDFVPCTRINFAPPNAGSCSGTRGNWDGALQSSPTPGQVFGGLTNSSSEDLGFWAYRDINLPRNTTEWIWFVANGWSHGAITEETFTDDVSGDSITFQAIHGGEYFGGYGEPNPLFFDVNTYWGVSSNFAFGAELSDYTEYPDGSSSWGYNTPFIGPDYWSTTLVRGKGRVVMGTLGSQPLGTRFTFAYAWVLAFYK